MNPRVLALALLAGGGSVYLMEHDDALAQAMSVPEVKATVDTVTSIAGGGPASTTTLLIVVVIMMGGSFGRVLEKIVAFCLERFDRWFDRRPAPRAERRHEAPPPTAPEPEN